jgi:ADP-heptose:LPS heptosyltransferase/predicted O-methyltransferase YrrM
MISFLAIPNDPLGLTAGERYLYDDSIAADFIKNEKAEAWQKESFDPPLYTTARRVLIIRCGGIGDLLFLTPSLAALLERYPQAEFTLCAFERYRPAVSHPALERLQWLDYPPKMADVTTYDTVIPLEGVIERDHTQLATQLLAHALGLYDLVAPRPLFRVPSDGLVAAEKEFPRQHPGQKFYGIGLRAGHDARTWPFEFCEQAAALILDRDPTGIVFLFGEKAKFRSIEGLDHDRVVWLPAADLNLRETLAVLGLMDGWIGPDSGLTHAAAALGIPGVGLFGAFPWQIRLNPGSSIHGLNGHAPCAPCHHLGRSTRWVPGQPCEKANCCVALAQITPDHAVQVMVKQMRAGTGVDRPERTYPLTSLFGPVAQRGDVHPELPRAELYHQGNWGGGAASIEEALFLHALVLVLKPVACLETGTETGWTAAHIAAALEANGRGKLITLEIDPKMAALARQNLETHDLTHRVQVLEIPALEYLQEATDYHKPEPTGNLFSALYGLRTPIDFALLDTHIPLRLAELEALVPHLSPGAVVCVHDTSPEHPMRGKTTLLSDLRAVPGFTVLHLPSPRGLTVLQWQ